MLALIIFGCIFLAQGEWVKEMENEGLYEGDIVLDPYQQQDLKKAHNGFATIRSNHWPYGKPIPYYFERSLGDREYLSFFKGGGCFSPIGRRNGGNRISLGNGCQTTGIAVHEIGHSLGIFHEQARPDRDRYVKILWNNIADGKAGQFYKQGSNIYSYGTPYDYDSVMHYGEKTFGKSFLIFGKKRTIETIDKQYQGRIGQRRGLSTIDIKQIKLMYKC